MKTLKKRIPFILSIMLTMSVIASACAKAETPEPEVEKKTKICMVIAASINDMTWGTSGYSGLLRIAEIEDVETAYIEQVESTDYEEAIRNFAAGDCELVLTHGGEFSEAVKNVAVEFPDIFFSISPVRENWSQPYPSSYSCL